MAKNDTSFKPGQSGNPKGKPRKPKIEGRPLAALLRTVSHELTNEGRYDHRLAMALRLWNAIQTGYIELEQDRRLTLSTRDWLDLVKWVHEHIDGELLPTARDEDWQAYQRDLPEEKRYANELWNWETQRRQAEWAAQQEEKEVKEYYEARFKEAVKRLGVEDRMDDETVQRVVQLEAAKMTTRELGYGMRLRMAVEEELTPHPQPLSHAAPDEHGEDVADSNSEVGRGERGGSQS